MALREDTSISSVGVGGKASTFKTAFPDFDILWFENPEDHEEDFRRWAESVGIVGQDAENILALVRQVSGSER